MNKKDNCSCGDLKSIYAKRCQKCYLQSRIGSKQTEETKKKMSKAHKNKVFSEEHKTNMSKAAKIKVFTKEHRLNMSKAMKERIKRDPDCVKTRLGKKHTEESKMKMSISRSKYLESAKPFISKPERELAKILDDMNINYMQQVRVENKCFDFFIPDRNLLIEVDGRYWHNLPDNKENDEYKNKLAKSKGYKLLRFWEDEIENVRKKI